MNAKYRRLVPEFGPETRFELTPVPPAPFRSLQENRFETLKAELLNRSLGPLWRPELSDRVRRAANEAAALAWVTPYPLLVFPVLFEEKTASAVGSAEHQKEVWKRNRQLQTV
jgi:hypothetical protein